MSDTMWMGMPGRGQGRSNGWCLARAAGRPSNVPHGGVGHKNETRSTAGVRMAKSQQKGVDSMMLETILALLGLATCALVLVSFWGSDLFGSRTRKRS